LQTPKNSQIRTQRKTVGASVIRLGAVACAMVAVLSVLVYFREDFPMLSFSSANPQVAKRDIPQGSILIPYDNGLCHLHAIDSATGQIRDNGVVNCLDAADQNTAAWKSLVDQQKATQIRKSFRNE
jgi:hypothetical protein